MPPHRRRQYGTGSVYQRRSDGRWIGKLQAGWTPTGTRRVVTVSAKTQAEAKRRLDAKRRDIATQGLTELGTRTTVKGWAETWLPLHANRVRPKAYTTDAGNVARWIIPTIGHRRLVELTPGDIRALNKATRRPDPPKYPDGRSLYTARQVHWTLMGMLRAAILEGHHVPQRILLTEAPAMAVSTRSAIPFDDALAILEQAALHPNRARWVAALLQGMRQGETLGLEWDRVDFDREQLDISWQLQELPYIDYTDKGRGFRVPDGYEARHLTQSFHLTRPKSAKGTRVIPLVPWMMEALREWEATAPFNPWGLVWADNGVPSRPGQPLRPRIDRQEWAQLQRQAGVSRPDGTPYSLHEARHTTASLLMEAGVPERVVMEILGHSTVAMTRAYQHGSDAAKREALEKVANRFGLQTTQRKLT
jgi:integrase